MMSTRAGLGLGLFLVFSALTAYGQTTLPVQDGDFGCITQAKADQYVRDFKIDTASFGGVELCNPAVDTKKLFNDLSVLERQQFAPDVANNLIRGFLPADNYYNWMKSQTYGVERGQDVPYATAYNSGGYFTMQDGWSQLSTLGRIGTIVHEARHTGGYYHIACQQGPYIGTGVSGCDTNYSYGGSHAIEMEYYARVSVAGINLHPIYKKMARLMAMGRSNFVFNQTPLKQSETLMILGASGQAYLWSNNQWIRRETPQVANVTLKRSSFGATLFDGSHAYALDPYQDSGFTTPVADEYSYFKFMIGDHGLGSAPLMDLEEFDVGRKRYVTILNSQNQMANFNFRNGVWNRAVAAPNGAVRYVTWAPSGAGGLFILDQNNRLFSVDPERMNGAQPTNEVWPTGTKNYARSQQGFFRLDDAGHLWMISGQGETAVATPEPVAQVAGIPLYDSFEVQP